jgi:hypothetical protein
MKKVLAEKVKIKPEKDNGFYYPEEDNNVEINLSVKTYFNKNSTEI